MNGGGPQAAPLRALRHDPVVIDDLGIIPRLARALDAAVLDGLPMDGAELLRWSRAWLVAWQGMLHDRGVIGTIPPWAVPIAVADLPALKGDPEGRRRSAAITLLTRAGIVADEGRGSVTLAPFAFVAHRAGLELDWGAVCRAARYEPAALLVVRALAESVVPPEQPAPVRLRELADRTGYALKQVRVALRRLADADVVRVSESSGAATQYCFGAVALPHSAASRPAVQAPTRTEDAVTRSPAPPAPVTAARRAVAVRMTLNGVTFSLAPGLTPHVELGPDGIPHISFDADGDASS